MFQIKKFTAALTGCYAKTRRTQRVLVIKALQSLRLRGEFSYRSDFRRWFVRSARIPRLAPGPVTPIPPMTPAAETEQPADDKKQEKDEAESQEQAKGWEEKREPKHRPVGRISRINWLDLCSAADRRPTGECGLVALCKRILI